MARKRARSATPDASGGPPASRAGRMEAGLRRIGGALSAPAGQAAGIVLVLALAFAVRLPGALDESRFFTHHPDESTYFNKAYAEYRAGGEATPLQHGGSGLPVAFAWLLGLFGLGPGPGVAQTHGAAVELDAGQLLAVRTLAVALAALSTSVVAAAWLLARQLVRPVAALGAALVTAFEPFPLAVAGSLMTEAPYTLLVVLAVLCVLLAQRHAAWLVGAGACLAGASMLRANGLAMGAMVFTFAALLLRRGQAANRWGWLAAGVATLFLLQAPYLAWRATYLPGAFDYGTNSRFWVDSPWNFGDAYWSTGQKEGPSDYFASHTLLQAWDRLHASLQLQFLDLFGGGAPDRGAPGSALSALLAAAVLAATPLFWRRRPWWFVWLAIGFTVATFAWIYPPVRSVRYFSPLVPLAAALAAALVQRLGEQAAWPGALHLGVYGLYGFVHVLGPLRQASLALPGGPPATVAAVALAFLALACGTAAFLRPRPAADG